MLPSCHKTLFGVGVLQLGDVTPFWSLLALRASFRLDSDVELGDDEAVVCPTITAAHRLRHPHILPVPLPDDGVVNKMPVLRSRVHPWRPVSGREAEDCVGDH